MRWFFAFVLIAGCAAPHPRSPRRAVYIHDLAALLDDAKAARKIVALVDTRVLTDLIPYGLGKVDRAALARWIADLHHRGARVIAPIAGSDRVRALAELGLDHFDGFVTEVEYWHAVDRAAAFADLLALIAQLRAAGARRVGVYLGDPTAEEAAQIARVVDFVFLNYNVRDPALAAQHERFAWFARAGTPIWPILYLEGEAHMHAYVAAHGIAATESAFHAPAPVAGFVYFTAEYWP